MDGGTYDMSSTERDEAILDSWTGIALDYTSGILSVASDRLIAISGIISAIRRRTGWTNLAGLWKLFLWRQVLWEKAFDAVRPSRASLQASNQPGPGLPLPEGSSGQMMNQTKGSS
jgi:hypothetical protein